MKKQMKPVYYDEFKCIADQCTFTCCAEWNIAVDQDTHDKWQQQDYKGDRLSSYTQKKEGLHAIKLDQHHRCPFLSDQKLCNLVISKGEAILSHTCATFPRQVHEYQDRIESSLTSCCPVVIDLFNQQDCIKILGVESSSDLGVDKRSIESINSGKASLSQVRDTLMSMIQNPELDINVELMIMFDMLLEIFDSRSVTKQELDQCSSDSYMRKLTDQMYQMDFHPIDTFAEDNELFLDLIENYRKEGLYSRFLDRMAEQAEALETETDSGETERMTEITEFKKEFGEYEKLFRNYLAAELFTNALLPGCNTESLVIMLQWISMEYAAIRHAIYLTWLEKGKQSIAYTDVRNCIVLISRITGYDQKDIYEYFDHSFQSRIWDWGYLALMIGM